MAGGRGREALKVIQLMQRMGLGLQIGLQLFHVSGYVGHLCSGNNNLTTVVKFVVDIPVYVVRP
jgi:hypothetical protein